MYLLSISLVLRSIPAGMLKSNRHSLTDPPNLRIGILKVFFNPLRANPTKWSNTLKHAICREIVWVCLTILWNSFCEGLFSLWDYFYTWIIFLFAFGTKNYILKSYFFRKAGLLASSPLKIYIQLPRFATPSNMETNSTLLTALYQSTRKTTMYVSHLNLILILFFLFL